MAKRFISIDQFQHVHDLVRTISFILETAILYCRNQCSEL